MEGFNIDKLTNFAISEIKKLADLKRVMHSVI